MSGRKIVFVLVIMLLAGCSVSRRGRETIDTSEDTSGRNLLMRIAERNITGSNFNINKAEIEVTNNGKRQKLIASMKYRNPGIYLLSMRNRTGIEAARAYITKDTVLINDRIYRKLYYGSTKNLSDKYGISTSALPLITGDLLLNSEGGYESVKCKEGRGEIEGYLLEKKIWYYLDCSKAKVSETSISDAKGTGGIRLEFSAFKTKNKFVFPGTIEIEDFEKQTRIKINISEIEFNMSDNIEFIPGRNYEKRMLR